MSIIDLSDTIVPKSDQLNADDLMAGPQTFTIKSVRKTGNADQPFEVHLAEFPAGRPYKPGKSMRRVMVMAWGKDASVYVGRRLTLYRDPKVKWAGQEIGGVRISHMSDLKERLVLALTETKGKRAPHTVLPLADAPRPAQQAQAPKRGGITDEQVTALGALMADDLQLTEREAKLQWLSQQLDRPIASPVELTEAEGAQLIDMVRAWSEGPDVPADEPGGDEQQEIGQ